MKKMIKFKVIFNLGYWLINIKLAIKYHLINNKIY